MDHLVYLDYKAKELDKLINGKKTMIIRGAMGRKLPYGRVQAGDQLFFIENKGDGLVKGKAIVDHVFNSEKLSKEDSIEMVKNNQDKLFLNKAMLKRFSGKRYLVLISLREFHAIKPFRIDRSTYANMDDWIPVEDINNVKIK